MPRARFTCWETPSSWACALPTVGWFRHLSVDSLQDVAWFSADSKLLNLLHFLHSLVVSQNSRGSLVPRHVRLVYNAGMPFRPQGNAGSGKSGRTPPPEETFQEAAFL